MTCSSSRGVSLAPHSSQRSPTFSSVFSSRSMTRTLPLPPGAEKSAETVAVDGEEGRAHERQRGHAAVEREPEHDRRDKRGEEREGRRARTQAEAVRVRDVGG